MSDITSLNISKPKKSDGTFVCSIKQPFVLDLNNCQIIHIKETNESAQFVFLKNKQLYNNIYDLNNQIITIVKNNCSTWFNTNMNPELIEDYYTNTLVYDKTHGELIKIKFVGENLLDISSIGNCINLTVNPIQLRFYKQKFVLECQIEKYEVACDIIDFSSSEDEEDEEDIACPNASEIEEMKIEVITKTSKRIQELETELTELVKIKKEMEDANKVDEIIKVYNQFV